MRQSIELGGRHRNRASPLPSTPRSNSVSNPLEELAERLLDVTQSGQIRLTELRATADNSLELQQQLLAQADRVLQASPGLADEPADAGEWERENTELRDELQWTRNQLLEAREQLEQGGGGEDAGLKADLEQAYRELEMLRNELSDAHDQLDEMSGPIMGANGSANDEKVTELEEQVESLQSQLSAAQSELESQPEPVETPEHDRFASSEEIAAERENLRKLQEEWHEKLRKGELEISLERAKMARERAEMEEKITMMEGELRALSGGGATTKEPQKGGKWFARLGLKGD